MVQSLINLRKEREDYEKIRKLSADERFAVLEHLGLFNGQGWLG